MRNSALKILREKWKGSVAVLALFAWSVVYSGSSVTYIDNHFYSTARLLFGRTRVMAAALGTSEDTECRVGISTLAQVRIPHTKSTPYRISRHFNTQSHFQPHRTM